MSEGASALVLSWYCPTYLTYLVNPKNTVMRGVGTQTEQGQSLLGFRRVDRRMTFVFEYLQ